MAKKYTYYEVKKHFECLGYILLSDKYINSKEKLILKDKDGYYYFANFKDIKNGHAPNFVGINNPYTIYNIGLWCKINYKSFELVSETYEKSNKYLKWRCLKKECNEIFEANWNNIYSGWGCSYCHGSKVGLSNCLATKNPQLASEWHPTKNNGLTPYDVTIGSDKRVHWLCEKGHEWQVDIKSRNIQNSKCPYCAGIYPTQDNNLLIYNPKLCEEWDYNKNDKNPEEYLPNSGQKVWWVCKECNYKWETRIADRNKGDGCRKCCIKNMTGENNHNWKGGVTLLHIFLRDKISMWKKESLKFCNYKCIITGKKFDDIHHLYSFEKILHEAIDNLNLKTNKYKINTLTIAELNHIKDVVIELHKKYGLGVCLNRDVHKLFHKYYGRGNNTPDQFEEFCQRYYNGEFNLDVIYLKLVF